MKERTGLILYFEDIRPALQYLTNDEKGKLFVAILDFAQFGIVPDMSGESPIMRLAFDTIRPHIEKDAIRYRLQSLRNTHNVWTRDHKAQPLSFDEWIWQYRKKYAADIVTIPELMQVMLTREDGLSEPQKIITHYQNGTSDNERYQTISNDILTSTSTSNATIPQRDISATPNATPTETAPGAETESGGEYDEQMRAAALEKVRGYNR